MRHRDPHNPKVAGSNPAPATNEIQLNPLETEGFSLLAHFRAQLHSTQDNPTKTLLGAEFPQDSATPHPRRNQWAAEPDSVSIRNRGAGAVRGGVVCEEPRRALGKRVPRSEER